MPPASAPERGGGGVGGGGVAMRQGHAGRRPAESFARTFPAAAALPRCDRCVGHSLLPIRLDTASAGSPWGGQAGGKWWWRRGRTREEVVHAERTLTHDRAVFSRGGHHQSLHRGDDRRLQGSRVLLHLRGGRAGFIARAHPARAAAQAPPRVALGAAHTREGSEAREVARRRGGKAQNHGYLRGGGRRSEGVRGTALCTAAAAAAPPTTPSKRAHPHSTHSPSRPRAPPPPAHRQTGVPPKPRRPSGAHLEDAKS